MPLILYSTNTTLAFGVSAKYYADTHWIWCSPFFRAPSTPSFASAPPSAIPGEIYDRLHADVSGHDKHSSWIAQNRLGLIRGAGARLATGAIKASEHAEIVATVNAAETADFAPLLYATPFALVSAKLKPVPPDKRAHPLSEEYIIESLLRSEFDVLVLR